MADVVDGAKRSYIMSRVKSSGNKSTEVRLVKLFKEMGLKGWRRNYRVKGKPDFVFLRAKTAVFADGCFWHGHPCRNIKPEANAEFWRAKIERNMKRDREVNEIFLARGWKVIRIWECELRGKGEKAREKLLALAGEGEREK